MEQWVVNRAGDLEKTGMPSPNAYRQASEEGMAAGFSLTSIAKAGLSLGFSSSFISNVLKESASSLGLDLSSSVNDLVAGASDQEPFLLPPSDAVGHH